MNNAVSVSLKIASGTSSFDRPPRRHSYPRLLRAKFTATMGIRISGKGSSERHDFIA